MKELHICLRLIAALIIFTRVAVALEKWIVLPRAELRPNLKQLDANLKAYFGLSNVRTVRDKKNDAIQYWYVTASASMAQQVPSSVRMVSIQFFL